jgi:transposase
MSSMPDNDESSHARAGCEEVILGVDTHKDVHVATVVTTPAHRSRTRPSHHRDLPTTAAGYRQLLV